MPEFQIQLPPWNERFCVECKFSNGRGDCTSPDSFMYIQPTSAEHLVSGVTDADRAPYKSLVVHRGAGWLEARLHKLCGREGRWYEREPGKPPNQGWGGQQRK